MCCFRQSLKTKCLTMFYFMVDSSVDDVVLFADHFYADFYYIFSRKVRP